MLNLLDLTEENWFQIFSDGAQMMLLDSMNAAKCPFVRCYGVVCDDCGYYHHRISERGRRFLMERERPIPQVN